MDDRLTASRTVTVINEEGLHLRAASQFVQRARRFQSHIEVVKDHDRADGKNMPLQLTALGAQQGDELRLEATGPDAEEALQALADLFASKFAMEPESRGGLTEE